MKKTFKVDAEKVAKGVNKSSSSSGFHDVFEVNYIEPSQRSQRIEGDESAKEKG